VGMEIGAMCREEPSSGRAGELSDDADELTADVGGWSDGRVAVSADSEGTSDEAIDWSGHEVRRSGVRRRIRRE
jgi:hypothetical protein